MPSSTAAPAAAPVTGSRRRPLLRAVTVAVPLAAPGTSHDLADRPAPATGLTYAVQMIVGFLVASVAAHHFADGSAKAPR
ncbi:hypothetical protein ACH41H_22425 [Streptomyces sp. NPDC020800]|uniref:hypothetical protein n=1 Tax=Streptomyces sp. NPDC020800 TaxID=3365092 RepID=UPI00379004AA